MTADTMNLAGRFRQVLAEYDNGALGGLDLAEALAAAAMTEQPAVPQALEACAPTQGRIETAAKAMQGLSSGFFSLPAWRALARVALLAADGVSPQEPKLCAECKETEVLGIPEHRVLCMDCAYESGRAAPVQVDEAKLAEAIGWEAPGWDNRKELASLFQDHCAIPDEMTLESIYPALIAVAGCGYELAKEHVLAAAAEHSRGGGR